MLTRFAYPISRYAAFDESTRFAVRLVVRVRARGAIVPKEEQYTHGEMPPVTDERGAREYAAEVGQPPRGRG